MSARLHCAKLVANLNKIKMDSEYVSLSSIIRDVGMIFCLQKVKQETTARNTFHSLIIITFYIIRLPTLKSVKGNNRQIVLILF